MDMRRVLAVATALLVCSGSLAAQETGTINGTVRTADGATLSGATVTVEGTNLGALTRADGSYTVEGVPAGTHTVRARYLGYRSGSRTVSVSAGGSATADFTLELDPLSMEELVVTGTATGTQKLEASYAVTTVNTEQISQRAPQSTADMVEAIPGFHVEGSGGVGGNNVFARGIPQPGSFRFISVQEDGLPVFQAPELAFLNVDQLYRVDETVRTMEAVRGGTASIFASNAPGGLINFVSKTGGEELAGVAKFTVGDYNHLRADFNYGGPLLDADDWRFNVGGFYRFNTGVRDPGFPANRGGQIKGNVTKLLDNGYVRIRGKYLNDRNIFYLPIPVQGGNCAPLSEQPDPATPCEVRNEELDQVAGFDPNWGTMTTIDAGRVQVPVPGGGTLEHNLRDGVKAELRQVGGDIQLDLGQGWSVRNNFRMMSGSVDFNAMFSLSNPTTAQAFAQAQMDALGGTGFAYSVANTGAAVSDPAALPVGVDAANGLVVESGWWNVHRPFNMFANELRLTKAFEEVDNTLTGAFYFTDFSSDEVWNFNNVLIDVQGGNGDHARLLDLAVTGTDDGVVQVTDDGFTRYGDFYRNAANNGHAFVGWLQDEWSPHERVTINAGLRFESRTLDGNTEVLGEFDLGGPTLADDQVTWGTGQFKPYRENYDELAVSGGVNVDVVPDRVAVFARATDGYRTPDFDQFAEQTGAGSPIARPATEEVQQYEAGLKYSSSTVGAFVTGFWSKLDNTPFSDEVVDEESGDLVPLNLLADSETFGLEAEVVAEPIPGARLDVTATLQNPEISNLRFDGPSVGGVTDEELAQLDGNQVTRIPKVIVSATPSYRAELPGDRSFSIFGTWRYLGDRFNDFANRNLLPDYSRFDAGFDLGITPRVTVQTRVENITNSIGLTEGNPRVGQLLGAPASLRMARPILGRSVRVSLVYGL